MSTCTDNHRLGRQSCGATFSGETQHCVAKVSWSKHPDGMAHISACDSLIRQLWRLGDQVEPIDPSTRPDLFKLNDQGRWVWLPSEDMSAFLATKTPSNA